MWYFNSLEQVLCKLWHIQFSISLSFHISCIFYVPGLDEGRHLVLRTVDMSYQFSSKISWLVYVRLIWYLVWSIISVCCTLFSSPMSISCLPWQGHLMSHGDIFSWLRQVSVNLQSCLCKFMELNNTFRSYKKTCKVFDFTLELDTFHCTCNWILFFLPKSTSISVVKW